MLSKLILSLFLLILPTYLSAKKSADEFEARAGDVVVRIAGGKCTNKVVLDQIESTYHAQFRKAELKGNGTSKKGCWTVDTNGVFVIFENGEQGYIPLEMFKPVETI